MVVIHILKTHVYAHRKLNQEPAQELEPQLVQSLMNPDGARTYQKYDEKRMLSEFARYIAQKERPLSMGYCASFARLVIRGCSQPLYKRFHHNKMSGEIKRQYIERKK